MKQLDMMMANWLEKRKVHQWVKMLVDQLVYVLALMMVRKLEMTMVDKKDYKLVGLRVDLLG